MFTPEQLMVFRGFVIALIAFIGLRGTIGKADKHTWISVFALSFATLGLFQGIRHWGASSTIVIVTATPLVNFAISLYLGRKISGAAVAGLVLVLSGVLLARWGARFQWAGFAWSIFCTIMYGILYESFARAKASSLQKCFYTCIGMGVLGLILSIGTPWTYLAEPKVLVMLVSFSFVGFLFWLANSIAFENLPTAEASILAQGKTPAVIIGAYLMLGERLTILQWMGIVISILGACYLSRWLAKKPEGI